MVLLCCIMDEYPGYRNEMSLDIDERQVKEEV